MCSTAVKNLMYSNFYLKKGKLKWSGTLEDLKSMVLTEISEEIAESTSWRSPSGGTWLFESEILSVTWHSKSQNVYFKGENGDDLTQRIYSFINQKLVENDNTVTSSNSTETELAMFSQNSLASKNEDKNDASEIKDISSDEGACESEDVRINAKKPEDISTKEGYQDKVLNRHFELRNNFIHEVQSSRVETNTNLSTSSNLHIEETNLHRAPQSSIPLGGPSNYNPEFEIGALKSKLESFAEKVTNKLDDLAIEINDIKENKPYSIVVLESRVDDLKREKLELCKTNDELCKENTTMKHTIADLRSTNKNLENEKASLLTALQIIQNELNQVNKFEKENASLIAENNQLKDEISKYNGQIKDLENEKQSLTTVIKTLQEEAQWNYVNRHKGNKREHNYQCKYSTNEMKSNKVKNQSHNRYIVLSDCESTTDDEIMENVKSTTTSPTIKEPSKQSQKNHNKNQMSKEDDNNNERKQSEGPARSTKKANTTNTIIIGDSMIKHLDSRRLKRSSKTPRKISTETYRGSTIGDMKHHIKPCLAKKPEEIILHVGTNNLADQNPNDIVTGIVDILNMAKEESPDTEIILSEIIVRTDNPSYEAKIGKVNAKLNKFCTEHNIGLIEHKNIQARHINPYGVHLNRIGTSILAKNFVEYLNKGVSN